MQSLTDSIKKELYANLSDSIEKEFGIKKVSMIPYSEKGYIIWSTDEAVIKREKEAKMAHLREKYPDDDGSGGPVIFVSLTKAKTSNNGDFNHDPDMPLCQPLGGWKR